MFLNAMTRAPAWLMLAMSLLMTLMLFHSPGSEDVRKYWLPWMAHIENAGLIAGYTLAETDYPPLSFAALSLAQVIGQGIGWDDFTALKATILGFQLLSTFLVLAVSGNVLLAAAFNAGVILSGVGLGYLDLFFAPTLIGAFWALRRNQPVLGVLLFGITCMIKWQPLLIAPFIMIHVLKIDALHPRAILAGLRSPILAWIAGLCVIGGGVLFMAFGFEPMHSFRRAASNSVFLSANALNVGWIEQFIHRYFIENSAGIGDPVTFIKDPSPWVFRVHKGMFYIAYLTTLVWAVQSRKSIETLLLFSMTGFLCYVTLNSGVHENHSFLLLILGILLAALAPSPTSYRLAALMTAMANLNLFVFYGISGQPLHSRVVGMDLSVPMAALFVAIWILFMTQAARRFSAVSSATLRPGASASRHDPSWSAPRGIRPRVAPALRP
jgi:hypothetical protein